MSLKESLLKELEDNRNQDISGQALAEKLGVSRNAVWKTINALKDDGYEILSGTNKGYRLSDECDLISREGISKYLCSEYKNILTFSYKSLDSTNNEAKRLLANGNQNIFLVLAEEQTNGRGRNGHSFYSPSQTGIYMTIVIHPNLSLVDTSPVTTVAATAVVRAIRQLTGKEAKIKWVNDVFLDGKKICGILTEAISDFETGTAQSVIIGIGVNISTDDFPNDIKSIAGTLNPKGITRNQLVAEILNNFLDLSKTLADNSYLNEYKEYSMVLGKEITYFKNNKKQTATAIDIDGTGGLIVKNINGEVETLRSGEISIKIEDF